MRRLAPFAFALALGCGENPGAPEPADLSAAAPPGGDSSAMNGGDVHHDGGVAVDGGSSTATPLPDGGTFMPGGGGDDPVVHGPAGVLSGVTTLLAGKNVLDASTDQGGGIWAVTSSAVYYFPPGAAAPFSYNQSNGLARGWSTWVDTYYTDNPPQTFPVSFSAVAGGVAGEAVVGNIGAIADRLLVNAASGAVIRVDNMQVTPANSNAAEYPEHLKRVVATVAVLADLNGTFQGTAYVGGWHGFSAFHGLTADCGCMAFEEHQHFIPGAPTWCDSTPNDTSCWDGEVYGLALSPGGDVWAGDRHFVQLLPQRSKGATTGFFDYGFAAGIDVFPGVRDEVRGLAVDAAGGVYVASDGNGLAWLAPGTHQATYWSSATTLPMNRLRGVAVDGAGDVWIATASAGLARLSPADGAWTYYLQASGLPSPDVNRVYSDKFATGRRVLIATDAGLAVYRGP